jgi:hypothetical protein
VKIAPGRSEQVRSRIVDELFAVLERALAPLMACRPRGFQLHESDPAVTRSGGSIAGSPGPVRSVLAGRTQDAAPDNQCQLPAAPDPLAAAAQAGFVGIGLRLNDYAGHAPTGCPTRS